MNQAKKAGFFGWPYFVGKIYAYAKYDFASNKISALILSDATDKNILQKNITPSSSHFISTSGITSGIYFVKLLHDKKQVKVFKMVIME